MDKGIGIYSFFLYNKNMEQRSYYEEYNSRIGKIYILSDGESITGLYFENQRYFPSLEKTEKKELDVIKETKEYLNKYFHSQNPKLEVPIKVEGTSFQKEVYEELRKIPYGELRTYKEIAEISAKKRKIKSMSTQAVGRAIGKNAISILIPCHRVVGTGNKLTGYAGGLDRKLALLEIEGHKKEMFKE